VPNRRLLHATCTFLTNHTLGLKTPPTVRA
jgi:hypothetical protein